MTVSSSSSRRLDRLPLQVFENLVPKEEEEEEEDNDKSSSSCAAPPQMMMDAAVLHQRFCDKLKDFAAKRQRRRRRWNRQQKQFPQTTGTVLTVGDFLQLSLTELVHALDPLCTYAECRTLRQRICLWCAATPTTVLATLRQRPSQQSATVGTPKLSTGIPVLDNLLGGGGLRPGTLTELIGKPGSGKTQLALQFCLAAAETQQAPHTAAYIETEGKLCWTRFHDMAVGQLGGTTTTTATTLGHGVAANGRVHRPTSMSSSYSSQVMEALSRIRLYTGRTLDELHQALVAVEVEACALSAPNSDEERRDHHHQDDPPMSLLIIDSIAAPVRRHCFGQNNTTAGGAAAAAEQAQYLMQFAARIKRLAEALPLAVVVVNQMGGSGSSSLSSTAGPTIPSSGTLETSHTVVTDVAGALGNSWHHCATTRLLIQQEGPSATRTITVTKSSLLKQGTSCTLYLGKAGFSDVNPDEPHGEFY